MNLSSNENLPLNVGAQEILNRYKPVIEKIFTKGFNESRKNKSDFRVIEGSAIPTLAFLAGVGESFDEVTSDLFSLRKNNPQKPFERIVDGNSGIPEYEAQKQYYRPLFHASRNVMKHDGHMSVFVSEEETTDTQICLDEVFGRSNRIGKLTIPRRNLPVYRESRIGTFENLHLNLLIYGKSEESKKNFVRFESETNKALKGSVNVFEWTGRRYKKEFDKDYISKDGVVVRPGGPNRKPSEKVCFKSGDHDEMRRMEENGELFVRNGRLRYISEKGGKDSSIRKALPDTPLHSLGLLKMNGMGKEAGHKFLQSTAANLHEESLGRDKSNKDKNYSIQRRNTYKGVFDLPDKDTYKTLSLFDDPGVTLFGRNDTSVGRNDGFEIDHTVIIENYPSSSKNEWHDNLADGHISAVMNALEKEGYSRSLSWYKTDFFELGDIDFVQSAINNPDVWKSISAFKEGLGEYTEDNDFGSPEIQENLVDEDGDAMCFTLETDTKCILSVLGQGIVTYDKDNFNQMVSALVDYAKKHKKKAILHCVEDPQSVPKSVKYENIAESLVRQINRIADSWETNGIVNKA